MNKIVCLSRVIGLIVAMLMTGCATYPNRITSETDAKIKTVAILDEIDTPTSLRTPANAGAAQAGLIGALIDAGVQTSKQKDLTSLVREDFDFQAFAEQTLRDSFTKAVKQSSGWILVASNVLDKADAVFVLRVSELGVDDYHSHTTFFPKLEYQPTVTVVATLIGNPPFEITGHKGDSVIILDPEKHPILYRRKQTVSRLKTGHMDSPDSHNFVKHTGLTVYGWEYCRNPEATKVAFKEAIELAVNRLANTWTVSK